MRSLSTRTTGVLILALGAWGGLVPFIGHYFHFALGPDKSWAWTTGRLYLSVLPAAAAVLGGLMLIGAGWRPSARFGALLAIAAGIWFAIGPDVSHLWNAAGAQGAAHGSKTVRVLEMLAYHTGLGALLAALGGYALPRFIAAREVVAEPAAADRRRPVTERRAARDEALTGGAVAAERDRTGSVAAEREPTAPVAAEREPTAPVAPERDRGGAVGAEREPEGSLAAEREPAGTATAASAGDEYAGGAPGATAGARDGAAPDAAARPTREFGPEPARARDADAAETTRLRPATAETATPAGGPAASEPREEPATAPATTSPAVNGAAQSAGATPTGADDDGARPHTIRRRRGGLLSALFSRR
jgi:hypothetical protein